MICTNVRVWAANRLHTTNIVVGKFQLYWQIYNILVAFLLNKTLSITAISVHILCRDTATLPKNIYTIHWNVRGDEPWEWKRGIETIESNCKHPSSEFRCVNIYNKENLSIQRGVDTCSLSLLVEKWLLSFSIFIMIILWANLFSFCTCLTPADCFSWIMVASFVICRADDDGPLNVRMVAFVEMAIKTFDQIFVSVFVVNGKCVRFLCLLKAKVAEWHWHHQFVVQGRKLFKKIDFFFHLWNLFVEWIRIKWDRYLTTSRLNDSVSFLSFRNHWQ